MPNTTNCEKPNQIFQLSFVGLTVLFHLVGLAANLAYLTSLYRNKTLQKQNRVFLANISFAMVAQELYSLVMIGLEVYWKVSSDSSGGSTTITSTWCFWRQIPFIISLSAIYFSIGGIAAGRWQATIDAENKVTRDTYFHTQEEVSVSPNVIVIIFLAVGWCFGFVPVISSLLNAKSEETYCFCAGVFFFLDIPGSFYVLSIIYLISEWGMITAYYYILWRNRQTSASFDINSVTHSLDGRYQLKQTIRITELLLPSVVAHMICCSILSGGLVILYIFLQNTLYVTGAFQKAYTAIIFAPVVHSTIHPFLCYGLHKNGKKSASDHSSAASKNFLSCCWGRSTKVSTVNISGESGAAVIGHNAGTSIVNFHLTPSDNRDILRQMWDAKPYRPSNISIGVSTTA